MKKLTENGVDRFAFWDNDTSSANNMAINWTKFAKEFIIL